MISGIGIAYAAGRGAHPLAGKRAPDLQLSEGRLYELLRAGLFVLITPRDASLCPPVLIRPDGYIAWAGDQRDDDALRKALARWTGGQ